MKCNHELENLKTSIGGVVCSHCGNKGGSNLLLPHLKALNSRLEQAEEALSLLGYKQCSDCLCWRQEEPGKPGGRIFNVGGLHYCIICLIKNFSYWEQGAADDDAYHKACLDTAVEIIGKNIPASIIPKEILIRYQKEFLKWRP